MLDSLYKRMAAHYAGVQLVPGEGPQNAGIMLIGEAPGKDEVANGRPFCGKAGRNLDEFLNVIGLRRAEIYISNVCKFRPVKTSAKGTMSNRTPSRREITEALPFLYEEIRAVAPRWIVTLGNVPLRACCNDFSVNIGECHGRILPTEIGGEAYRLFALYHPASIIYNRALADVYHRDLLELKKQIGQI